jgi:hypothetical protein
MVGWSNPVNIISFGPDMLKEMEQQVIRIKQNLKVDQNRQKIYADQKRTPREFKMGDHVYLRVRPRKSSLKMGACAKLAPRYCYKFQVKILGILSLGCDKVQVKILKCNDPTSILPLITHQVNRMDIGLEFVTIVVLHIRMK